MRLLRLIGPGIGALLPAKTKATLALLNEASSRVRFEYLDLARLQNDPAALRRFGAIIWVKLVQSEHERLVAAFTAMHGLPGLPDGHSIQVGAPPGSSYLYCLINATTAESAAQLVHGIMRRGLDDAGLTVDEIRVDVGLAPEDDADEQRP